MDFLADLLRGQEQERRASCSASASSSTSSSSPASAKPEDQISKIGTRRLTPKELQIAKIRKLVERKPPLWSLAVAVRTDIAAAAEAGNNTWGRSWPCGYSAGQSRKRKITASKFNAPSLRGGEEKKRMSQVMHRGEMIKIAAKAVKSHAEDVEGIISHEEVIATS